MMQRNLSRLACALLGLVFALGTAYADEISVDDLINLKKAGFSEAEVKAEIRRSGPINVNKADAERLRKAGFSEAFVAGLRGAGPGMTLDRVKKLSRGGASPASIIEQIVASGAKFSNFVIGPRKVSLTLPIGPLRCLPMMISAVPLSAEFSL